MPSQQNISNLIRGIRNLAADEQGKTFRSPHSFSNSENIGDLVGYFSTHGTTGVDVIKITDGNSPGLHHFIMGVDGFANWDWIL